MSENGGVVPELPRSAYVLAWSYLVGQLVTAGSQGLPDNDEVSIVISMVLSALVVGWVSAGVLRGRRVRLVLAWVITVLVTVFEVVALFFVDGVGELLLTVAALATSVVSIAALRRFSRSDYVVWQRKRPAAEGPAIGQLVAIGVAVGLLGGFFGPADDGVNVEMSVSESVLPVPSRDIALPGSTGAV